MRSQIVILSVWIISFFACIFLTLGFLIRDAQTPNIASYTFDISSIYIPYVLPIITFWLSEHIRGKQVTRDGVASAITIVISILFNVIMLFILARVYFEEEGENVIEDNIKLMTQLAFVLGFLVGPAIGYFFSSTGSGAAQQGQSGT